MIEENNDKTSTPGDREIHRNRRPSKKDVENTTYNAGIIPESQRMRFLKEHGPRRIQISFSISELAWDRLTLLAQLFNLNESSYAKAVLYKDLGVWTERLDHRRKKPGDSRE